jgi:hypothetical protein
MVNVYAIAIWVVGIVVDVLLSQIKQVGPKRAMCITG